MEGKVLACHSANQLHAQTGAENEVDRTLATTATDTHASMRRLPDGMVPGGISWPAASQSAVNCTLNTKGAALRQRLLKGLNENYSPC